MVISIHTQTDTTEHFYVNTNRLFTTLVLENLLLSVICCLLFELKRLQCNCYVQ